MKVDFAYCLTQVLLHEGGYVNDPKDPGGETNMGISKRSFPRVDIRNLTRERAAYLYETHYWIPAKCAQVHATTRPLYFDTAVNCGVGMAVRLLQMSMGLDDDGVFGPDTAGAAMLVKRSSLAAERMAYYERIIKRNPDLAKFRRGWANRVNSYLK